MAIARDGNGTTFARAFFGRKKKWRIFAVRKTREISSVGLEHLPYKQGVNGSNPLSPT